MKSIQVLAASSARAAHTTARSSASIPQLSINVQRPITPRRSLLRTTTSISSTIRPFSSYCSRRGIIPDSSDPKPPNPEPSHGTDSHEAAPLSDSEYHEVADQYMNTLQLALEEYVESEVEKGMEVEYSVSHTCSPPSLQSQANQSFRPEF